MQKTIPIILSLLMAGIFSCSKNTESAPNVILIMTDDQGYGDIGAHGNPYVLTPNLDHLREESLRLTNFHVDPCCAPTRAALLTGKYSARSGVWHTIGGRSLLQGDKTTMADIFSASGYRTGIFGKWHLGENYPYRPTDRGFQEAVVHGGGVVGSSPDFFGNDYYDDTYYHNGQPENYEGYCNTVWFNEASEFIRKNQEHPFFCFISTNVPHAPLMVDDKYIEPYRSKVSERLASYYGMISRFDEDLGYFLRDIREMGLETNTIVIFMSDNGPCPWYGGIIIDDAGFVQEGYSAGMRGGKIWGYENAHRVPFFIRWPAGNIGGGRDITKLTAHFDLLPTLIDLCALQGQDVKGFDGVSLKPILLDPDVEWPDRTLFVHNQRIDFPAKYKDYQVLTEKWRLVRRQKEELYDIRNDPGQRMDLAGQHQDVVKELIKEYEFWWNDVSGDFDRYNGIIVGNERENPAKLYAHDAHRTDENLIWVIDVDKEGLYEIKTSRWPLESGKMIVEDREGEIKESISHGFLNIGNILQESLVTDSMKTVDFMVHLKSGQTCLSARFMDGQKRFRADYVLVRRMGTADPDELKKYEASDPDVLLKKMI